MRQMEAGVEGPGWRCVPPDPLHRTGVARQPWCTTSDWDYGAVLKQLRSSVIKSPRIATGHDLPRREHTSTADALRLGITDGDRSHKALVVC